jgi:hypothetical protein
LSETKGHNSKIRQLVCSLSGAQSINQGNCSFYLDLFQFTAWFQLTRKTTADQHHKLFTYVQGYMLLAFRDMLSPGLTQHKTTSTTLAKTNFLSQKDDEVARSSGQILYYDF